MINCLLLTKDNSLFLGEKVQTLNYLGFKPAFSPFQKGVNVSHIRPVNCADPGQNHWQLNFLQVNNEGFYLRITILRVIKP